MNTLRNILLKSDNIRKFPKQGFVINKMFEIVNKHADKITATGISQNKILRVKMTSSMKVKEVKIDHIALIGAEPISSDAENYIRKLCDIIETEFVSAAQNAQNKFYKQLENISQEQDQNNE